MEGVNLLRRYERFQLNHLASLPEQGLDLGPVSNEIWLYSGAVFRAGVAFLRRG